MEVIRPGCDEGRRWCQKGVHGPDVDSIRGVSEGKDPIVVDDFSVLLEQVGIGQVLGKEDPNLVNTPRIRVLPDVLGTFGISGFP